MESIQKSARIVDILFILGTVSGLLSLNVVSILNVPDYLVKLYGNKTSIVLEVLSVLTMGISLSIMSVVLYPIIKKFGFFPSGCPCEDWPEPYCISSPRSS